MSAAACDAVPAWKSEEVDADAGREDLGDDEGDGDGMPHSCRGGGEGWWGRSSVPASRRGFAVLALVLVTLPTVVTGVGSDGRWATATLLKRLRHGGVTWYPAASSSSRQPSV